MPTIKQPQPDRTATNRQRRRHLHTGSKSWRIIRNLVLDLEALCRMCGVVATEVDHIDGDDSNHDIGNLAALCKSCHSAKTMRDEHYKRTGKRVPIPGCDAHGYPTDPTHHWNVK